MKRQHNKKQGGTKMKEKTFYEKLDYYINRYFKDNSKKKVYSLLERACVSSSLYYDMRGIRNTSKNYKKSYKSSFENIIKIALALNLTLKEITDLLSRARLTFSPCSTVDNTIIQFLKEPVYKNSDRSEYDLSVLDGKLYDSGEKTLFSEQD